MSCFSEFDEIVEINADDHSDKEITEKYFYFWLQLFTNLFLTLRVNTFAEQLFRVVKKIWLVAYTPTRDQSGNVFKIVVRCGINLENINVSRTTCRTACR